MKKLFFILLALPYLINSIGQSNGIDSLKNLLTRVKEDTTEVFILGNLSKAYDRLLPDSALFYGLQGMTLAQQISFLKGEHFCRIYMANAFWSIGDFAASIKLVLPKLKEIEASNQINTLGLAYVVLFNDYRDQGDYAEAMKYSLLFRELDRKSKIGQLRISYAALSGLYLMMNKLDSAKYSISFAFTHSPDPGLEGWPNFIAGEVFNVSRNYDSALYYYHRSIPLFISEDNFKDVAGTYNRMSAVFKVRGQTDSSIYYAHQSLDVGLSKRFAREAMDANMQLSSAYELINKDSTWYYYKQAMVAKDTLYNQDKQRQIQSYKFKEELNQQETEAEKAQQKNRIKIYALIGFAFFLLIIATLLLRNIKYKQKAYALLRQQKMKTEETLDNLKITQAQLIHQEKMASLGELTAGIAHEIQNPLNFVNNFSEVNKELVDELRQELKAGKIDDAIAISNDIKDNEEKINHHGKRADAIVKGMLQHSRSSSGQKEATDINALADEYLRLAYHGLKAKDKSFNATTKIEFDNSIGKINIIPQDIGRVILNLINNAFYAVDEKMKHHPNGYEPTVSVSTKKNNGKVEISVKDNGYGIPQKVLDKIFQPFFTTKPTGQGTGLGLSLSYDIVKTHNGEIKVNTKEGEGSEFVISLPIK